MGKGKEQVKYLSDNIVILGARHPRGKVVKKHLLVIFISLFLLVFVYTLIDSIRIPLTAMDFSNRVVQAGYSIAGPVSEADFSDTQAVTESVQAIDPKGKFAINFYIFSSSNQANATYKEITKDLYSHDSVGSTGWSMAWWGVAGYQNGVYTETNNGVYSAVSRIGNTLIYISTESENKNAVNHILKKLRYQ